MALAPMHVRHFDRDTTGLQETMSPWRLVQNIGPYVWYVESKKCKAGNGKFNLQYSCKTIIIIIIVYG